LLHELGERLHDLLDQITYRCSQVLIVGIGRLRAGIHSAVTVVGRWSPEVHRLRTGTGRRTKIDASTRLALVSQTPLGRAKIAVMQAEELIYRPTHFRRHTPPALDFIPLEWQLNRFGSVIPRYWGRARFF
jgi:hypothetical protein